MLSNIKIYKGDVNTENIEGGFVPIGIDLSSVEQEAWRKVLDYDIAVRTCIETDAGIATVINTKIPI